MQSHKKQKSRKILRKFGLNKKPNKSLEISQKATIDNKLSHQTLLLNYAFEYGIDFENRIIQITGEITHPWFDTVDMALTKMESHSGKAITIKINSGGGDTYEAMAIVGRLLQSKCAIHTIGYGHIMSAATLILASGKKGKRQLSRLSEFMWHESWYGTDAHRHSEHKHNVAQVDKEERKWAKTMAEFTNRPEKFWLKEGVGLDAHFSPEELLEMGVVDELF